MDNLATLVKTNYYADIETFRNELIGSTDDPQSQRAGDERLLAFYQNAIAGGAKVERFSTVWWGPGHYKLIRFTNG